MADIEGIVFTAVAAALRSAFPGIKVYPERVNAPEGFPCATLIEDDNSTYTKTLSSTPGEHHATLLYTANAYSNLSSGKKAQCKAIMALIDSQMLDMGFTRVGRSPAEMPNADTSVYRMIARYRCVAGQAINGNTNICQIYRT